MELILKSDNRSKMEKVLMLARKLGINVTQNDDTEMNAAPTPPKGKKVSVNELLTTFGEDPEFPSDKEIRTKVWSSSW